MSSRDAQEPFIVVLAVDQSEYSEFSFKWYLNHIHRPNCQLHIIHVPEFWGEAQPNKVYEMAEQTKAMTETLQENYMQWASSHGVQDVRFAHPPGREAWHEIVRYAERVGAGLIVVGSRGQGKLRRTFLGSVSDSVLHHAHVPVLVCRNKDAEV